MLENTNIDGAEIFIRLDIADYCLSGECEQLVDDVMSTFDRTDKRYAIMRDTLTFLITYQFVKGRAVVNGDDEGAYRAIRGSGMGIVHSGDLCDVAFAARVETYLCRDFMQKTLGVGATSDSRMTHFSLCNEVNTWALYDTLKLSQSTSS